MASYLQIPTFKASKDHFNKQDEDRFVKLVSDIELTQIHITERTQIQKELL